MRRGSSVFAVAWHGRRRAFRRARCGVADRRISPHPSPLQRPPPPPHSPTTKLDARRGRWRMPGSRDWQWSRLLVPHEFATDHGSSIRFQLGPDASRRPICWPLLLSCFADNHFFESCGPEPRPPPLPKLAILHASLALFRPNPSYPAQNHPAGSELVQEVNA